MPHNRPDGPQEREGLSHGAQVARDATEPPDGCLTDCAGVPVPRSIESEIERHVIAMARAAHDAGYCTGHSPRDEGGDDGETD